MNALGRTRAAGHRLGLRTWILGLAASAFALGAALRAVQIDNPSTLLKLAFIVTAAIVAVLALQAPHFALFAALVAATFDRTIVISGLEIGLAEVTLVMLAPAFARAWTRRTTSIAVKFGATALLSGSLIAAMFAFDPSSALVGTVNWALVLNMVVGGIGIVRRDPSKLRVLAMLFGVLGAVTGLLGSLQSQGIYTIVGPPYAAGRVDSSFGYYSNFASFEALAAVVAVGSLLYAISERERAMAWAAGACATLSGYGLLLSLSRGAIIAAVTGVAVLLLIRINRPGVLVATAVALTLVGFGVYAITPAQTISDFSQRFTETQGGDVLREQLQTAGEEVLRQTPAGIGFGGFRRLIEGGYVSADQALAHSHNLYLQVGLDAGWLGLLGFVVLVCAACLRGFRLGRGTGSPSLQAGFAAALIGFLVQGQVDYFFFEFGSLVAFSILVMGAFAPTNAPTRVPARAQRRSLAIGGPRPLSPHRSPPNRDTWSDANGKHFTGLHFPRSAIEARADLAGGMILETASPPSTPSGVTHMPRPTAPAIRSHIAEASPCNPVQLP